jgi:phosphotransferase system enzyme I (PtsI)
MLKGIPVSNGVAIAPVVKLEAAETAVEEMTAAVSDTEAEVGKLERSVEQTESQLQQLMETAAAKLGEEQAAILSAHLAFLQDEAFVGEMKNLIRSQSLPAKAAVKQVMDTFVALFESMEDPYMRERAGDIRDVGSRILKNLSGTADFSLAGLNEPFVLVAEDVTPSDTLQLPLEYVRGIAAAKGGATSHAAILARSLGIPAVMGVGAALLDQAENGQLMIMDGSTGEIYPNPDDDRLAAYTAKAEQEQALKKALEQLKDLPAETVDGHRVELAANMSRPEEAENIAAQGADGVGLFRSEFLFMDRDSLPGEEEQFEAYRQAAVKLGGKPVIIRTLDVGGDKHLPYLDIPKEENPFLGWRAIRISLSRQDLFKTQLRALLRASAYGKILVMFPMISHLEQLRAAKQAVEEAKAELRQQGIPFDEQLQVGMMMEIPGACVLADTFAKEVDFFSIGTNDLVQYTLAVDRMNENISQLYSYFHPAVLKLIAQVIEASHRAGIWTGLCGEMAADPVAAELLLGLGLDEFSANVNSLPYVKQRIRNLSYEEAKQTAKHALSLDTAEEVEQYLRSRMT